MRLNKCLSNERTVTNHLGYRTTLKLEVHFNEIKLFGSHLSENILLLYYI